MPPRVRFRFWIAAAAVPILAAPLVLLGDTIGPVAAALVAAPSLLALFWLLFTTPPDAIRLPYLPGFGLVLLGSIWVQSLAAVLTGTTAPAWIVWFAVAAWPALTLPARRGLAAVRPPPSPWWMAVPAWSPGLALLPAVRTVEHDALSTALHFGASVTTWPSALLIAMSTIAQRATPDRRASRAGLLVLWHAGLGAMIASALALAAVA
jgi:hypothetical protein